jgi:hypothetical protein
VSADASAESRYAQLVAELVGRPGVTQGGKGFGASALKVHGRIFAMLSSGSQFVVKLPRERVAALIDSGQGAAYDAGKGRPMREWLVVPANSSLEWRAIAEDALAFVDAKQT